MRSGDYMMPVKDRRRALCVVLSFEDGKGTAKASAKSWSPAMEQLLGVNVETFDAARISSEGIFEAKLASVTAVLPVEEGNQGATAGDVEPASKHMRK